MRLESLIASGKNSQSIDTLRKYAAALGKRVEVHFVWFLDVTASIC